MVDPSAQSLPGFIQVCVYVGQELSHIHPAEAGASWGSQAAVLPKPPCLQARHLEGQTICYLLLCVRTFVSFL